MGSSINVKCCATCAHHVALASTPHKTAHKNTVRNCMHCTISMHHFPLPADCCLARCATGWYLRAGRRTIGCRRVHAVPCACLQQHRPAQHCVQQGGTEGCHQESDPAAHSSTRLLACLSYA